MTKKKPNLSVRTIVRVVNNKKIDSINYENYFKRLVEKFIDDDRDNFDIVEIIILSCTLLEGVIKDKLKRINPALLLDRIDPVEIAILSKKQKHLLRDKNREIFIKTSCIKVLLERYSLFFDIEKYYRGMNAVITARNNIIHIKDDYEVDLFKIEAIICKYIFPYLESNISISKKLWSDFNKISDSLDNRYIQELIKKIIKCQKDISLCSELEIKRRLKDEFANTSTEFAKVNNLPCPACKYSPTALVDGIDFEYEGPDEYSTQGYNYSLCGVCKLELDSSDISEMLENYDKFFDTEDEADEWYSALDCHHGCDYI